MIRHLLKLVWNRKRANFLLVLEMAISFLVALRGRRARDLLLRRLPAPARVQLGGRLEREHGSRQAPRESGDRTRSRPSASC